MLRLRQPQNLHGPLMVIRVWPAQVGPGVRLPTPASARMDGMSGWDQDPDEGRAPICPYCGVTALPAELSHVIDTDFVCDNADCDAYGEPVDP